jgi:hypothetical protein
VASSLAHGYEAVGTKQIAAGFAGENLTLGHIPPRTG